MDAGNITLSKSDVLKNGGTLEAAGRLFKSNVKLYVYPFRDPASGKVITVETMEVAPHLRHLYTHLLENHFVEGLQACNPDYLPIFAKDVLAKLQAGDGSWEEMVPPPIVRIIKDGKLFGWKPSSRTHQKAH